LNSASKNEPKSIGNSSVA